MGKTERTWRVWSTIHVPHAGLVGNADLSNARGLSRFKSPLKRKSMMYCYPSRFVLLFLPKFLEKMSFPIFSSRPRNFNPLRQGKRIMEAVLNLCATRLYVSKHISAVWLLLKKQHTKLHSPKLMGLWRLRVIPY